MKVNRKICAARTSGFLLFQHSKTKTMVGCTKMPSPGRKFCPDHQHNNNPSVCASDMNKENVQILRKSKKPEKGENTDEDVFNVVG